MDGRRQPVGSVTPGVVFAESGAHKVNVQQFACIVFLKLLDNKNFCTNPPRFSSSQRALPRTQALRLVSSTDFLSRVIEPNVIHSASDCQTLPCRGIKKKVE